MATGELLNVRELSKHLAESMGTFARPHDLGTSTVRLAKTETQSYSTSPVLSIRLFPR